MALLTRITGERGRPGVWRRGLAWLVALTLLSALPLASAQSEPSSEYQLKAAFLHRLTQFVEWPAGALPKADTPIVIGVLGDDPFGSYLDDYVRDEKIGRHPLVVRRYKRVEDALACQLLFISRSESADLDKDLAALKGHSVLTVGDTDGFIRKHGGMVRFGTEAGKIRLNINVKGAKAGELAVSSKILALATIEEPERK